MALFQENNCQYKWHKHKDVSAYDKFKILFGMEILHKSKHMKGNAVILYLHIGLTKTGCL